MDQTTLMLIGISLTVAIAVGGVAYVFLGAGGNSTANKRVARVSRGTTGRVAAVKGVENVADSSAKRRRQVQETLKEIERKNQEVKSKPTLGSMLEQADWNIDPRMFHIITIGIGVVVMLAFVMMAYAWYIALGIGFAVGFGFPRWFLNFKIKRRKKAFTKEFANAIDVIVRGVKAGLPLNECLKIISNESPEPVGPEFRQIVEGLKVGVTLEDGLKRMYERMPIPEVNFFQIVLTIQQKTGGNLSEALGNLSGVLRDRKRLHGKIQALSSERHHRIAADRRHDARLPHDAGLHRAAVHRAVRQLPAALLRHLDVGRHLRDEENDRFQVLRRRAIR